MSKKITKKSALLIPRPPAIYIGPSLPGLAQYTVFKHGQPPEYVKGMIEKNEVIGRLIVPVAGLQEARRNLHTPGHILNFYAKQLMKG